MTPRVQNFQVQKLKGRQRRRRPGGVYSYSSNTVEGPRAPAVKLKARHSSLTRVEGKSPRWIYPQTKSYDRDELPSHRVEGCGVDLGFVPENRCRLPPARPRLL